ncbi:acyl-CoA dehydrogenase family protein [Natrinema caseinilyticum]|uniref:acyl-CoA dehydrogenase family protein n=1 Tax=Natrinema caseinilyticum TaxID=2961570 RepID=UPI0020C33F32|nr:acyl-CoA dehydrogenase family protein [Natrinema caseinilyticum]
MEFEYSEEQRLIRRSVADLMSDYDRDYWRTHDNDHEFPWSFWKDAARAGWVSMTLPEEYGGSDSSLQDAAVVLEQMAKCDAGLVPVLPIARTMFVGEVLANYTTEAQRDMFLEDIVTGEAIPAFAITEPGAGFDALGMETRATKTDSGWELSGEKVFISGADIADHVLVVARTSPKDDSSPSSGISLFMIPTDADGVTVTPIDKVAIRTETTTQFFLDDVEVPDDHLIGERGRGWYHVLDLLNTERITLAAGLAGAAELAIDMASEYAREREVFDRPIGKNQGIQLPLAEAKVNVTGAWLQVLRAADVYDRGGEDVGIAANSAKVAASNAAYEAANVGMQTFGGWSVTEEYDINRLWRDARFFQIGPVSNELAKTFIAERELDLPKSY